MNDFIIVIGRQYGAGGRRLGKKLAEVLDVPYYDKELLSEAADSLGFSKEPFPKSGREETFCIKIIPFIQLRFDFCSIQFVHTFR